MPALPFAPSRFAIGSPPPAARSASANPPTRPPWARRASAPKRCAAQVAEAVEAFHAAAARAGSPHLRLAVGPVHLDDKHVRAVEFAVERGRHVALVIVKARGDVTLVGPFRTGKTEGPCRTFAWDAAAEIEAALGDFLERFLEEATTP